MEQSLSHASYISFRFSLFTDIQSQCSSFLSCSEKSISSRGNEERNYSTLHGAGRVMSRKKAFETLSLEEYRKAMEGIYTTTANQETIDEAPMAYKQMEDIIDAIRHTVDNVEIIKPVYSFKASER